MPLYPQILHETNSYFRSSQRSFSLKLSSNLRRSARNISPTDGTSLTWWSWWPASWTSGSRVSTASPWWEEWDWWVRTLFVKVLLYFVRWNFLLILLHKVHWKVHTEYEICSSCSDDIFISENEFFTFADACVETSPVLDHDEGAAEHYHLDTWSPGKSNFYSSHCHLYIRCTWDAIVRERLHGRKLLSWSHSSVATKYYRNLIPN